jgi:hypothetical protein
MDCEHVLAQSREGGAGGNHGRGMLIIFSF